MISGRAFSTADTTAAASRRSVSCRAAFGFTWWRLPVEKLSSTDTSPAPEATSASTVCDPIKPAPPVTRILIEVSFVLYGVAPDRVVADFERLHQIRIIQ